MENWNLNPELLRKIRTTLNSKSSIIFTIGLFLFLCTSVSGQSKFQWGVLPSINVSKPLKKAYKLNLKGESRETLYRENDFDLDHRLADVNLMLSRRVGFSNALAIGYLVRVEEGRLMHRLIQQYSINQNFDALRMSHRFSADQSFEADQALEHRYRYRLTVQLPLIGRNIDAHEYYLKLNNEYLNAFTSDAHDLEVRLVAVLGFEFNDNNKIEFGIDQRMTLLLDRPSQHRTWTSMSWYLTL